MVAAALADEEIPCEVARAYRHPYQVSALAEPWRVWVAGEHLGVARSALERLQLDMVAELDAQAGQADEASAPDAAPSRGISRPAIMVVALVAPLLIVFAPKLASLLRACLAGP